MTNDVYAQDLILTMQKRPFLKMLRKWRDDSVSRVEIELLSEIIEAVQEGEFDG